jgi:hypothetical protein
MSGNETVVRIIRLVILVAVAIGVFFAVALGVAFLGHEFLVLTVGEDGIPAIDDTPLMFGLVAAAYLAGGVAGIAVLTLGWIRFIRRRA